jgi:hypothetical protein
MILRSLVVMDVADRVDLMLHCIKPVGSGVPAVPVDLIGAESIARTLKKDCKIVSNGRCRTCTVD